MNITVLSHWLVRVTRTVCLVVVGMAAASGCSDSQDGNSTNGAAIEPHLSVIEARVFRQSCTFSTCHGSESPEQGLNLAASTHGVLVNRPSSEVPQKMLVVPNFPEQSYLIEKLTSDKPTSGSRMPYTASPLSSDKIAAIRSWIEQGAQDD